MRVVLDTNVVVSALLCSASVPGRVFVRVLNRGTILIVAPAEFLYVVE